MRSSSSGVTLMELLIGLAIVALLAGLASPQFLASRRNAELATTVNGLVGSLHAARSEAMKRGHAALLRPLDGHDWQSGWVVFIDMDDNLIYSATIDVHVLTQPAPSPEFAISLSGTAADNVTPYLMFDVNGYCRTKNGGFAATTFEITRPDLVGTEQLQQTRRVMVASTGRVRSCTPSSRSDRDCRAAGS